MNAPQAGEQYPKWRDKDNSALAGIAAMPEAADNNHATLALLTELAWTPGITDLDDWSASYAVSRYGAGDPHALVAWKIIGDTAYGMTRAGGWSKAPDGLFGARPSPGANKAAAWGPEADRHDTAAFDLALTELLQVAPALRDNSAYCYDLADVARQVLSNRSRMLLPQIKAAYDTADRARFDELTDLWLDWIRTGPGLRPGPDVRVDQAGRFLRRTDVRAPDPRQLRLHGRGRRRRHDLDHHRHGHAGRRRRRPGRGGFRAAANCWTSTRGIAEFQDFTLS